MCILFQQICVCSGKVFNTVDCSGQTVGQTAMCLSASCCMTAALFLPIAQCLSHAWLCMT